MSWPPSPSQMRVFGSGSTCHCSRPSFPVGGTGTRYQPARAGDGRMSVHPCGSTDKALGVSGPAADELRASQQATANRKIPVVTRQDIEGWRKGNRNFMRTPDKQNVGTVESLIRGTNPAALRHTCAYLVFVGAPAGRARVLFPRAAA